MSKTSMILLLAVAWLYLAIPINAQWMRVQGIIPFNVTVRSFVSYSNESGERILFAGTEGAGVFRSTDDGLNWIAVNTGLTDFTVYSLFVSGTTLFAGTDIGVFRSSNNGTNWSAVNTGFTGSEVYSLAASGTDLFAGAFWGGVFRSTDSGNSWNNVGLYYVVSLLKSGTYLFAGAGNQVFRSSNNGLSWQAADSGLSNTVYGALALTPDGTGGTNLLAGAYWDSVGIFLSTNNGIFWYPVNTGLTNKNICTIVESGTNLFSGTGGGVFLSTNNGLNWIAANEGFPFSFTVVSLGISGTYIFAGSLNGVWRRPLSDFVPVELTSFSATVNDDNVELSWITSTETNNQGFEVERKKEGKFETIGFVEGHGTTTETQVYSFIDKYLITGKYNYRLKQIDYDGTFEYSNVVEVEVTTPSTFSLEQNYPNPFNPITFISYQLPVSSNVTLKVYDILGKEVMTLFDEYKTAGRYEVEFNASQLPSGIYFYQLKAGELTAVKKMILLK